MSQPPAPIPPFPTRRAFTSLVGTLAVGIAAAAASVALLGDTDQLPTLLGTAAVCFVAAAAAVEPVRRLSRSGPEKAAPACLVGMAIRLGVTAAGCWALAAAAGLPARGVALWATLWYILLLVAEVRVLVRYFASLTEPHAPPATPAVSEIR